MELQDMWSNVIVVTNGRANRRMANLYGRSIVSGTVLDIPLIQGASNGGSL